MNMYCEEGYSLLHFQSENREKVKQSSLYFNGCVDIDDWDIKPNKINDPSVLDDNEKGKLVKRGKTTMVSEMKTMAALKSHSDAERRRRERINAHLATLRNLIPHNEKMDKATLLGEVINQVKLLKAAATEASKDQNIPMDSDEVKVEIMEDKTVNAGRLLIKASLCCEYKSDCVSRIRKAIIELAPRNRILKCEISTLGGRVKCVVLIAPQGENATSWEATGASVRAALSNILLDNAVSDQEVVHPQKRRRGSVLGSSSCLKLE